MKPAKIISAIIMAVATLLSFSACSANESIDTKPGANAIEHITVALDYTPNTNHTGLYVALAKGFYKDALLDVELVQPPEGDAIAACSAAQVEYAIGFQDLLAPAFTSDTPMEITAVATLLQHNTSCVMSAKGSGMDTPKGLEGNTFLTWETPVELAMMESVVKADGGDWSKVKLIPNTVTDEAQDIKLNPDHAIWVYYGWGGINAKVSGVEVDMFYFKDINPAFDYYSPVIVANNGYIEENPERVKAFLDATRKGYEYAVANPEEAAQILIDGDETGSLVGCEELVKESQLWMAGQYIDEGTPWGYIDAERWNAFYKWLGNNGLTGEPIPENTGFTNDYLN